MTDTGTETPDEVEIGHEPDDVPADPAPAPEPETEPVHEGAEGPP